MDIFIISTQTDHLPLPARFADEDGHRIQIASFADPQSWTPAAAADALWVFGPAVGPDLLGSDSFQSLTALISRLVRDQGQGYLGQGVGMMALAQALGGQISRSAEGVDATVAVEVTEDGANGVLMDGLPLRFSAPTISDYQIDKMPTNATCLATSDTAPVQVMRWESRAYATQFVLDPSNRASTVLPPENPSNEPDFAAIVERLYMNWLQTLAQV